MSRKVTLCDSKGVSECGSDGLEAEDPGYFI